MLIQTHADAENYYVSLGRQNHASGQGEGTGCRGGAREATNGSRVRYKSCGSGASAPGYVFALSYGMCECSPTINE